MNFETAQILIIINLSIFFYYINIYIMFSTFFTSNVEKNAEIKMKNYKENILNSNLKNKYTNFISTEKKYKKNYNNKLIDFITEKEKIERIQKIKRLMNKVDINGKSILMLAIIKKKTEICKLLIENGADVNIQDNDGKTALMYGIEKVTTDICELLIKLKNINLTIISKNNNWSAIDYALERDNIKIVKLLIEKNGYNKNYFYLSLILEKNNLLYNETCKLLIERGHGINLKNSTNNAIPLFLSIENKNDEITELLIKKGANLQIKDNKMGFTPLNMAIISNNSTEVCNLLIERGASLINLDTDAYAGYERYSVLFTAITSQNFDVCKLLIEKGVSVNQTKRDGETPLLESLDWYFNGKINICKLLIENGANVNVKIPNSNASHGGYTPLLLIISKESLPLNDKYDICKLLIEKGANVNVNCKGTTNYGNEYTFTPLSLAFEMNNTKIFQLLIDHGALFGKNDVRVDEVDYLNRNSFLTEAVINGYTELFEQILTILLNKGLKVDFYYLLINAIQNQRTEIVLKILIHDNFNITTEQRNHALTVVKYRNKIHELLRLDKKQILDKIKFNKNKKNLINSRLMKKNSELSQTTSSIYEKKFGNKEFNKTDNLISSLKIKDIKNCKELIANGTDLNIKDNDGKTALMYASEFSNEIFELLIKSGADLNLKDNKGRTILMIVLDKLHPVEKTKLLIESDADLNIQDDNGNTCLLHAITRENYEICKLLIESGCNIDIKNKYGKSAKNYSWFIEKVYHLVH